MPLREMYAAYPTILKGTSHISILTQVPTYEYFLNNHLRTNKPCLIPPDLIRTWPAKTLWVRYENMDKADSSAFELLPNWEYLRDNYGDEMVTVAKCDTQFFSDQERIQISLREVIDMWTSGSGEGLYVKDWHLANSLRRRKLRPFYSTPEIFLDDWMNSYWMNTDDEDDFRFVYMGITGTFTPLHRDVYTSYSWSTNITGIKLWRLFPPNVSEYLRRFPDRPTSEVVYDVRDVDLNVFRLYSKADKEAIVVKQPPGWTIFVPSGWYHQVENLSDAISINHNWCNINNIQSMYVSLRTSVNNVEDALSDVHDLLRTRHNNRNWEKEWIDAVQGLLKKDSGWDWDIFWKMIALNFGQLRNPPEIQDSNWPVVPPRLRPPSPEIASVVKAILHDFITKNQQDIKYIPELSISIENITQNVRV